MTSINYRSMPVLCNLFVILILNFSVTSPVIAQEKAPLRLGIISLAPPSKIHKQWQPFASYLSAKIDREVTIVVPRGFKKIEAAVENNEVDLFYVNSHIFYRLVTAGKAVPVAQMQNLDGSVTSNSVLFVRNDSGITSLSDLKGEKIAFVSPMGAGGYLAPRAALYKNGIKSSSETQEQFTKNLSSSIHKVLLGDVKAGAMCGLNYQLMSKRVETGDLRIIGTSNDYPENVLGAHPDVPEKLYNQLTKIIIGMDKDADGRKVLDQMKGMKILKFVSYDKKSEDITRNLLVTGEL